MIEAITHNARARSAVAQTAVADARDDLMQAVSATREAAEGRWRGGPGATAPVGEVWLESLTRTFT
jgi:hypothetical protein